MLGRMEKTYGLLRTDGPRSEGNKIVTRVLVILICISVMVAVLNTFDMPLWFHEFAFWANIIITLAFTIEYALRIWTAPLYYPRLHPALARLRYIFSPLALIDLCAILPFYLLFFTDIDVSVLMVLRLLRLLVFFKFTRYLTAFMALEDVFRKRWRELLISLTVVFALMFIASAFIYSVEHPVQPEKFTNIFSGIWWAISTLLTIGYGDIYPVTDIGRVLAAVVAILGVGLIAVPTGIISAGFMDTLHLPPGSRRAGSPTANEAQQASPELHPADEIMKYKALLDAGAITPAEYDRKKRQLLR